MFKSEVVKAEMTRLCMHTAIVPGGCISIFKLPMLYGMCFKSHMRGQLSAFQTKT